MLFTFLRLHRHLNHPVQLVLEQVVRLCADLLNHANHLVANGYAGHSTRHTAVLDMQVVGADTTERNAHNGITRALQFGLRLVNQLEPAVGYSGVGEHCLCKHF